MRDWGSIFLDVKSKFEDGTFEKVDSVAGLARTIGVPRRTLTDAMEKHGVTATGLSAMLPPKEWDWDKWQKETGQPWWTAPGCRVGYLDIEADSLKTDFGMTLTWCIKQRRGPVVWGSITKEELFREGGDADKALIDALITEMRKYDALVTYFGTRYDIPWIRTKAMHYDLDFPRYGEMLHMDLFYTVKSKMNLSRKSLDNATHWLGIDGKTHIDKRAWRMAKYGNTEGLAEVLDHNVHDVEILELLHDKLAPFRKWTKTSI